MVCGPVKRPSRSLRSDPLVDFPVLLDTGSTDLWVYTGGSGLKFTNTTNLTAELGYAIGGASGPIAFAELELGAYRIPSQGMYSITHVLRASSDISQPS